MLRFPLARFGDLRRALLVTAFLVACGPAPAPAEAPEAPAEQTPEPAATPVADDAATAPATTGDASADSAAPSDGAEAAPAEVSRELRYRIRPGGVSVVVDDVEFDARAQAVRVGRGWGVEVKIEATLKGEGTRSLLSPSHGPLAFAGVVRGDTFSDERDGDQEQVLTSGQAHSFARTWPEGSVKPLSAGQSLELKVGLWGLGRDAKSRQPIRQFLLVKMTAGKKNATPVLTPPDQFMSGGS